MYIYIFHPIPPCHTKLRHKKWCAGRLCLPPQICARCDVPPIHTHLTPSCHSPLGALDEHLLHIHQHCSWCTCTQTWHGMACTLSGSTSPTAVNTPSLLQCHAPQEVCPHISLHRYFPLQPLPYIPLPISRPHHPSMYVYVPAPAMLLPPLLTTPHPMNSVTPHSTKCRYLATWAMYCKCT